MVAYPSSVYAPRTKDNLPGYPYTPANKYIGYSEDITYLENEVLAMIADMVGTGVAGGVKGGSATLAARLTAIETNSPQLLKTTDGPTFDHVHLTTPGSGDAVKGPASATNTALAVFDGTTGKVLQNSVATLDNVGLLSVTGITAGGAERLKIWTYTHTITAAEVLAGQIIQAVTAVTFANVRSLSATGLFLTGADLVISDNYGTSGATYRLSCYLQNTTSILCIIGSAWAENDKLSFLIVEAV